MNAHVLPELPAVLETGEVAVLLRYGSSNAFLNNLKKLQQRGFPGRLPGMRSWSRAAVLRWIETNGETYLPADLAADDAAAGNPLERRYAK